MSLDLDGYFARIHWSGALKPDLATLTALLGAHMRAIPFENFDALLGRRVRLDLDSLQDKLVRRRRGGYCFEHATLFAAVLEALGFKLRNHLARVVLGGPKTASSRTHMFNLVELPEGKFVTDPGFGGPAALVPVLLAEGGSGHWFERDGADWMLRGPGKDGPIDLWVTELATDYPIDFELSNHYVATHPDSIFTSNLMLNRFTEEGRVSLMNRDASIRRGDEVTGWQVADRRELRALLEESFGIDLPEIAEMRIPAIAGW
ncbi:MAG TPA: arylamine N-acetyltransferase [Magnetospirillaceae bacterium]|nr:arylamine N-acetyltransferase [Magnetospirillaceae bacterium]